MLPYQAPVKLYQYNSTRQIVDSANREIFEIQYTSRDLMYEKKMEEKLQFLVDLMNGVKQVQRNSDSGSYDELKNSSDSDVATIDKPILPIKVEVAVKKKRGNPNFFKGMISPMFGKKWKE